MSTTSRPNGHHPSGTHSGRHAERMKRLVSSEANRHCTDMRPAAIHVICMMRPTRTRSPNGTRWTPGPILVGCRLKQEVGETWTTPSSCAGWPSTTPALPRRSAAGPGCEPDDLDPKTLALVRLAALVAVGGAVASYGAQADTAVNAGASAAEIVDVLVAVVPVVGLPCVVAAAPKVALALGYDINDVLEHQAGG